MGVYEESVGWVCTGVMNMNIGVAALCYSAYLAQPIY